MVQATYRYEKDFLGEKEIPADVYYGVQTLRAKENFPITGYRMHEELIRAFAIVKKQQLKPIWKSDVYMKELEMPSFKRLTKSLKASFTSTLLSIQFKAAQERP